MSYTIYNEDNIEIEINLRPDLVYADMIYENFDFSWVDKYWDLLKTGGIFIVQTDYHTNAYMRLYLDAIPDSFFVNEIIGSIQDWGGVPKKGFAQKHDTIYIYSKGTDDFYWDDSDILIPKATAGTALDKKGTGMKRPMSVWSDLGNFSTLDKERVKTEDGKNIQWQKPLKVMHRLLSPFTKKGDLIVDPFLGSGSTGAWCIMNDRNFIGVEKSKKVFDIAKERLSYIEEQKTNLEREKGSGRASKA